jgi:hypothetical protein
MATRIILRQILAFAMALPMLGGDNKQRPTVPSGAAFRVSLSASLFFSTFSSVESAIAASFNEIRFHTYFFLPNEQTTNK